MFCAVGWVHRAVYDRLLVVIVGVGVFLVFPLAASSASVSAPSWNGAWAETTAGDPQGHIYLREASGSATVTGTTRSATVRSTRRTTAAS